MGQRTEWTKSVFAMSSAAVGLLVTALLTRDAVSFGPMTKCMLFTGGLSFGLAATTCLSALMKSAKALEHALNGQSLGSLEDELNNLESQQHHGFLFGLVFLGLAAFFEHLLKT